MKKHTFFILFVIVISLTIGIWRDNQDVQPITSAQQYSKAIPLHTGIALPSPQSLPALSLKDMNGNDFSETDFKRHWSFVFFGYSTCPDICPTTLDNLKQLSARLKASADVHYYFITLNPEHDTPSQLKAFLNQTRFESIGMMGLTGDKANIDEFAQSTGTHRASSQSGGINHLEHSGAVLLINPEGKLMAIFTSTEKPHAIAQDFKDIVHRYNAA